MLRYFGQATPEETRRIMANIRSQVFDVRELTEQDERIPGSEPLPYSELDTRAAELDRVRPLILCCADGKRAWEAAGKLAQKGFQNVIIIEGGLAAWRQAGYPVIGRA